MTADPLAEHTQKAQRRVIAAVESSLPEPECRYGYPVPQLRAALGDRFEAFARWSRGETGAVCDGREYDHDTKQYSDTGCGPHGLVVYPWDVKRFVAGLPTLD